MGYVARKTVMCETVKLYNLKVTFEMKRKGGGHGGHAPGVTVLLYKLKRHADFLDTQFLKPPK